MLHMSLFLHIRIFAPFMLFLRSIQSLLSLGAVLFNSLALSRD